MSFHAMNAIEPVTRSTMYYIRSISIIRPQAVAIIKALNRCHPTITSTPRHHRTPAMPRPPCADVHRYLFMPVPTYQNVDDNDIIHCLSLSSVIVMPSTTEPSIHMSSHARCLPCHVSQCPPSMPQLYKDIKIQISSDPCNEKCDVIHRSSPTTIVHRTENRTGYITSKIRQ